ncbi:ribonuclease HI [Streptomyces sp. BH106]|uniref:ribonuclease HI n=1 Tax=Streptomyces sp. BH106 TaxID=3410409 RepID=UPI003CF853A3
MPEITIAAVAGSSAPSNPGHAAWAYVLADADFRPGVPVTGTPGWDTVPRAELVAVRELLRDTTGPILIRTRSTYVRGAVTKSNKAKKNLDLLEEIWALAEGRSVAVEHVYPDQRNPQLPLTEAADEAANLAAKEANEQTRRMPCPDCGREVLSDDGIFACGCGRISSGPERVVSHGTKPPKAKPKKKAQGQEPSPSARGRALGLAKKKESVAKKAAKEQGSYRATGTMITARRGGYCPRCKQSFPAGTSIVSQTEGWVHADC